MPTHTAGMIYTINKKIVIYKRTSSFRINCLLFSWDMTRAINLIDHTWLGKTWLSAELESCEVDEIPPNADEAFHKSLLFKLFAKRMLQRMMCKILLKLFFK